MTDISASRGQASFPPWHQDYIPTADEWLNCFSNKADETSLEAIRKTLFPSGDNNGDPAAQGSLYDRVSSLEGDAASAALILSLIPVPVTIIGTTLDDYDGTFFGREQSRLLAALEQQQRVAQFTQQSARKRQQVSLALKKVGITS